MLFSEPIFLFLFLPILLAVHFSVRPRLRNALLLLASLAFYAWGEHAFVLAMLASIMVNYGCGIAIDASAGRSRRLFLTLGAIANLGLLVAFKYANFLAENLNLLTEPLGIGRILLPPIHLPVGISFFTFQALSYLVDVYRGTTASQRNPLNLALFISLFPQLIAGPIVRYHELAKQLTKRVTSTEQFACGVRRFSIGLAKKCMLANPLALQVDRIFALDPANLTLPVAWFGLCAYALQIYFDFSGYSDMAVGLGRMFGFRLPENFNLPYISRSITEFWRRWHISLSSWFRDYLYIPLGGNRVSRARTYVNLVIVFILCGLWHGASWNFLIWGLIHGAFLVLERAGFARILARAPRVLSHAYVLLVVLLAWAFFRADTLPSALQFVGALFGLSAAAPGLYPLTLFIDSYTAVVFLVAVIASSRIPRVVADALAPAIPLRLRNTAEALVMALLLLGCAMMVAAESYSPFIYFRF